MMTPSSPLAGYKGFVRGAQQNSSAAAKPEQQLMTDVQLAF